MIPYDQSVIMAIKKQRLTELRNILTFIAFCFLAAVFFISNIYTAEIAVGISILHMKFTLDVDALIPKE